MDRYISRNITKDITTTFIILSEILKKKNFELHLGMRYHPGRDTIQPEC